MGLLTATTLTRDNWAEVLDVTPEDIERWLAGKDIPPAPVLSAMVDCVEMQSGARSLEAVSAFYALSDCKLQDISSAPVKLQGTLGDYLMHPMIEAFRVVLRTIPIWERYEALVQACEVVRRRHHSCTPSCQHEPLRSSQESPEGR
jgi:hypothetical protein